VNIKFIASITNEDRSQVLLDNILNVNRMCELCISKFKRIFQTTFTYQRVKSNQLKRRQWIAKGIIISNEKLKYLHMKYKITKSNSNIERYKLCIKGYTKKL